jgi:flagellar hook assembly protein FlgD
VRLLEAIPNPFGGMTSIRYSLANESPVELSVFDASGRLVRNLVSDVKGSGVHVVEWDGVGNDGQAAPSGTYFYRLEVGDWQETRSMTLVK